MSGGKVAGLIIGVLLIITAGVGAAGFYVYYRKRLQQPKIATSIRPAQLDPNMDPEIQDEITEPSELKSGDGAKAGSKDKMV